MNPRLTQALAEGERHTPDPDQVLAGIRAGITRRRRHHRYLSVGVTALTVLALTGTAVLIGRPDHRPTGVADGSPANPTPRPTGRPSEEPVTPVPPQQCRLRFGWLPTGLARPLRSCGPREQSVLYPMAGGRYLSVSIDQSGWPGPVNTRGWTPLTVHGRPGYLAVRATRAFVCFPLPSGRWVDVEYGDGQPGGPAVTGLAATARRIAEHISEQDTGPIRVPLATTYLPKGQQLAAVGNDSSRFTVRYQDGSGRNTGKPITGTTEDGLTSESPRIDTGTGYRIDWSSDPRDMPSAGELERYERLPDIQGRPAYLLNQGDLIVVADFHGGWLSVGLHFVIRDVSQPGPVAGGHRSQLVRIAQGVRWLG
ncbi:hypothetical protein [Micromonospora auratinigra]|uniref:Uncharacterized protein n=1 Tax=Micromonospora auratinigra TaxID=261654 RepID=A0A1A9A692_9ACTN|nr:hypothetical protein [Micromonospora auratinigra]SBT51620.1 hypothetical protein GA0070611_5257 [Micromonospora auratinigra]